MSWINSCIRAIQRHSGEIFVDPFLQDNILLPSDFAEYIYHVGNAYEMHSIIKSGLIFGGKSLRRDRQSVFFTAVNPIDVQLDRREVEYMVQAHLEISSQYGILVQFTKLLRERNCDSVQLDRTQSLLSDTPAICIDKVVCIKTREELYCKTYRSPCLPRATLVPNFQQVQNDVHVPDSRKSHDREKDQHRETCGSEYCIDFSNSRHSTFRCWTSWHKSKRKSSTINWAIRDITQTRTCCSRTTRSRRRSTTSVENPRIWLLKWVMTKSSSATTLLRKDNVPISLYIGKLVSKTAHAE